MTKQCPICGLELPLKKFGRYRTGASSGYRRICRTCKYDKEKLNPNHKRRNKGYNLKRLYGLSLEKYDALLKAQNGVCAICHQTSKTALCVDHDHACCPAGKSCGKCIRGLLCGHCNLLLGDIETHDLLEKIYEYVRRAR